MTTTKDHSLSSPPSGIAAKLRSFHDRAVEAGNSNPSPSISSGPLWRAIERNHHYNMLLWEQEDQARRRNVADSEIVENKRSIDRFNQQRNNAIEAIDETLLTMLSLVQRRAGARRNSETPGSMIDRLSILSLKCYHMQLQTQRTAAGPLHVATCQEKLAILNEQRHDLEICLDRFLDEASRGDAYFKLYRQFKMYNDPALNPSLHQAER